MLLGFTIGSILRETLSFSSIVDLKERVIVIILLFAEHCKLVCKLPMLEQKRGLELGGGVTSKGSVIIAC